MVGSCYQFISLKCIHIVGWSCLGTGMKQQELFLLVCGGWSHFFLLNLHSDKVEIVRALVQNCHCSEVRQWRGNCNSTCLRKSTRSLVGFMFVSILKKVQRNYYSRVLFIVSTSVIFRTHLNCVMETLLGMTKELTELGY